ncbi:MAG: hypothetical protein KDB84_07875 [Flavobacteriales bacterium]|nr:hypothetical protein [Flavobacteriales bacterium]
MKLAHGTFTWIVTGMLIACGTNPDPVPVSPPPPEAGAPLPFPQVEDNVRHDTLLIQTTFDLLDGTFVMVASNVNETFEGVRLIHYRPLPDSAAGVIATSSPGYDSWTMLPTFHATLDPDERLILANFGERESWGQKLMTFDHGFEDIGFLDVALPVRETENDTLVLKRRDIGPYARTAHVGDTLTITFATDSVYLYEGLHNDHDIVLPSHKVRYTLDRSGVLMLWVGGAHAALPLSPV